MRVITFGTFPPYLKWPLRKNLWANFRFFWRATRVMIVLKINGDDLWAKSQYMFFLGHLAGLFK